MTTTGTRPATAPPARARVHPALLAMAGSLCIALSSVFIKVSGASGSTSAFWRCLFSLPVLAALVWWERRRGTARRRLVLPVLAGVGLGVDFVLWGDAIALVGAGIATVLLSVQVVIVPAVAYLVFRERPSKRFVRAAPVLLAGIVLAGGLAGTPAFGPDPVLGAVLALGAGVGFAAYLVLMRRSTGPGARDHTLFVATLSAGAVAVAIGVPTGRLDLSPGWPALGWLLALALIGQIAGWLLISTALPRLSSATGATMMLLQPVGAILMGVVLLGERPSAPQLAGCLVVLGAVAFVGAGSRRSPRGGSAAARQRRPEHRSFGGTPPGSDRVGRAGHRTGA
ncbi:drug/metabolite transporter (DMT)-like permease [Saccharothrix algeriensis]|uniref:Drug/metabolite transporter (DMT)-like permease n=1 Tax=Saccharothrix algeriensis TaxID=173560 RepID=A0ABS2SG26_9PSEU|nr:DMT family transporter [Saccharothrix algeriensis]MBM7815211.1 drug/metabolite transporter (DMT)-like permease [Saccharothrix algeriensis]